MNFRNIYSISLKLFECHHQTSALKMELRNKYLESLNTNDLDADDKEKNTELKSRRLMLFCFVFIGLVILSVTGLILAILSKQNKYYNILYLNDIHLDPLYIPTSSDSNDSFCRDSKVVNSTEYKFGRYGCDTPYATVESLYNFIKNYIKKPDIIIIGGDLVGHELNSSTAVDIIINVTTGVKNIYNDVPVYLVPGNNDFSENYGTWDTDKEDLQVMLKSFEEFLNEEQVATFSKGGYYYIDLPSQKLRLLIINSVIYSTKRNISPESDPYDQFKFISDSCNKASLKGYKCAMTMHIPPGVAYYDFIECFHLEYAEKMYNVVNENNIMFVITAHTHTDMFIPLFSETDGIYSLSSPSISPDHGNNPCFRIFNLRKGTIINYIQYYADIMLNPSELDWKIEYDFQNSYSQKDVSNESIHRSIDWIMNTAKGKWTYRSHVYSMSDKYNTFYYCLFNHVTADSVKKCLSDKNQNLVIPYGFKYK